jgi:N-acylneuraminate cytidylyltransferase
MTGRRILPLVIDRAYACDIDDERDWRTAETMLADGWHPMAVLHSPGRFPEDLRLVVLDFDGVLTDNRVWIAQDGDEWVACSRSDGLGIELLKRCGIDAVVLSTEQNPVVGRRCLKLGLPYEQAVRDKGSRLRALLEERGVEPSQVVYVGNDVNDLDCMRLVGCAVAVADAHQDVLRAAHIVLARPGGAGAVRELCERLATHVGSLVR